MDEPDLLHFRSSLLAASPMALLDNGGFLGPAAAGLLLLREYRLLL